METLSSGSCTTQAVNPLYDHKVYVVDDDTAVRDALQMLLTIAGYRVTSFACGVDFLATHTAEAEGCLILDINMPGMDGLEVQAELNQRQSHLSVIILSGYGSIPLSVRALKAGAADFLSKPVTAAALLAAVKQALAQRFQSYGHDNVATPDHETAMPVSLFRRRAREIASRTSIETTIANAHLPDESRCLY